MENKEPKIQEVVNKNITLTETDTIASSVEKVYDSVVTVSNYTTSLSGIGTGFVYKKDFDKWNELFQWVVRNRNKKKTEKKQVQEDSAPLPISQQKRTAE